MSVRKLMDEAFDMMGKAFNKFGASIEVMSSENWRGEEGIMFTKCDGDGNVQVKGKVKSLRVNGFLIRLPQHVLTPPMGVKS